MSARLSRLQLLAFFWGVAEGTLFFIVPDVIISYGALTRGLKAAVVAAGLAAMGAAVGGAAIYQWSAHDALAAHAAISKVPAVSEAMIDSARQAMESRGWFVAALQGPLTSTPYKVYAMLAPQVGAPFGAFVAATIPIRLPRFLFVTVCFALGRLIAVRVSRRIVMTLFTVGWILFYIHFWMTHPG